jgi:hypothetical protein
VRPVRRRPCQVVVEAEIVEQVAPLPVRVFDRGPLAEVQHVEDVKVDRCPLEQGGRRFTHVHPLLQPGKARRSGLIQGDNLTVEHYGPGR